MLLRYSSGSCSASWSWLVCISFCSASIFSSASFLSFSLASSLPLAPMPLTPPVTPEIPPPATAPRTPDSTRRLNSLLPHISLLSPTNFSAIILIASCPASVGPSVATPVTPPAKAALIIPGFIPDFSNTFSITPSFIPGVNCFIMYAGNIESSAPATEPAITEAPGAICPVSSYMF